MSRFQNIKVSSCHIEEVDNIKAHGWVFPPSPVTNGVLVGMTDTLAHEIVGIIRDVCCDDNGNTVMEGSNACLLTFAARIEQNLAQKSMRKSGRDC